MKRLFLPGILPAIIGMLLLAGCTKSPTGPEQTTLTQAEMDQIIESIEADPLFTSDGSTLNDGGVADLSEGSLSKAATPILPIGWGRKVTAVDRNIAFEHLDDSTVVATVTCFITGELFIAAKYTPEDTGATIITKPLSQTTSRKIKFFKNAAGRWVPREVTPVKGGTEGSLITINRVDVIIGSDSLSVTDPLALFLKLPRFGGRELPSFGETTPMTVRVTVTSSSEEDIISLHRPWRAMGMGFFVPLRVRMNLVSSTPSGSSFIRVYELSWNAHVSGRHHVFVDAITRESLFDDAAPFSSQIWGIPYVVE